VLVVSQAGLLPLSAEHDKVWADQLGKGNSIAQSS
jgi:hypothetical protein